MKEQIPEPFKNKEEYDRHLKAVEAGKIGVQRKKEKYGDEYSSIQSKASKTFWDSPEGQERRNKLKK